MSLPPKFEQDGHALFGGEGAIVGEVGNFGLFVILEQPDLDRSCNELRIPVAYNEAMPVALSEAALARLMDEAHETGVRLEVHEGLPIWELCPSPLHTMEAERIVQSIGPSTHPTGCGCHRFQDMAVRFPDGSIRRPDIGVFCERPAATQEATRTVPKAVIEVVSPGSEVKDLELSPPFYLRHGVLDVVVFDPRTGEATWFWQGGQATGQSPWRIELRCGCAVTV